MAPLPDAIDTVRWLRESGRRLALLTNGAQSAQRRKIARFEIADLFDAIFVEGELGFGKPDERVYRRALSALDVKPADAWMVGDNLEWDVAAPQKLGMSGVWIDARGRGIPDQSAVKPDYIVRSLAELRSLIKPAGLTPARYRLRRNASSAARSVSFSFMPKTWPGTARVFSPGSMKPVGA